MLPHETHLLAGVGRKTSSMRPHHSCACVLCASGLKTSIFSYTSCPLSLCWIALLFSVLLSVFSHCLITWKPTLWLPPPPTKPRLVQHALTSSASTTVSLCTATPLSRPQRGVVEHCVLEPESQTPRNAPPSPRTVSYPQGWIKGGREKRYSSSCVS